MNGGRVWWTALAITLATPVSAAPQFKGGGPLRAIAAVNSPQELRGVAFTYQADGAIRGGIADGGGKIVFGTMAGTLVALDPRDGHELWHVASGAPISSTPALANDLIVFSNHRGLSAVRSRDGRRLWSRPFEEPISPNHYWQFYDASPNVVGSEVFIAGTDGTVTSLHLRDGSLKWVHREDSPVFASPAVADGLAVFGNGRGEIVALDGATGAVRWRFRTDGYDRSFSAKHNDTRSVVAAVSIADGIVVAGGRDGMEYGLDLATGALRWKETHDGSSWILATGADNGVAYAGSGSAYIVQAADLNNGKERWRAKVGGAVFAGISLTDKTLVAMTLNGALVGLDRATGREQWRWLAEPRTFSTPDVAANRIYFGDDLGRLTALATADAQGNSRPLYRWPDPKAEDLIASSAATSAANGEALAAGGFQELDAVQFEAMIDRTVAGREHGVLVLGERPLPAAVTAERLKAFIQAGGHLVLTSLNPLGYGFDEKGAVNKLDEESGARQLGLAVVPLEQSRGYHLSTWTPLAHSLGIGGTFSTSGPASNDPAGSALATDEFGAITATTIAYDHGGRVTILPFPRVAGGEPRRLVNAIRLLSNK